MRPELRDLDPAFAPAADWIIQVAEAYLGGGTVTSTRRGFVKQLLLNWERGGVQVCAAGTSAHEHGLAFDFVVPQGHSSPHQAWLGWVWNTYVYPGTWSPNDSVHFAAVRGCLK